MSSTQENKYYFFTLRINLMNSSEDIRETIDSAMDIAMKIISTADECYSFYSNSGLTIVYFLKTVERKRSAQVRRTLESQLPMNLISDYVVMPNTKQVFYDNVLNFKSNENWVSVRVPIMTEYYDASDIALFNDYDNFFPWQKQIHSIIFDGNFKDKKVRIEDDRTIHVVVDLRGAMGKSKFIKFLTHQYSDEIEFFPIGSAQQLRSYLIASGPKKVYLLDIPRTLGRNDSLNDIISVAESCKNGLLSSPMFGKRKKLYMVPPIVILFCNQHLPYEYLSMDRWKVYLTRYKNDKVVGLKSYNVYNHVRLRKLKKFKARLKAIMFRFSPRILKLIITFYLVICFIKYRILVFYYIRTAITFIYNSFSSLPGLPSAAATPEVKRTFVTDLRDKAEHARQVFQESRDFLEYLGVRVYPTSDDYHENYHEINVEDLINRALKNFK